ncbi:MAG: pilus assembly protein PilP [Thermodesulfobacteriota bacterium]
MEKFPGSAIFLLLILLGIQGCNPPREEGAKIEKMPSLAQKTMGLKDRPQATQTPGASPLETIVVKDPPYNPTGKPDPFQPTSVAQESKEKAKKSVLPLEQFELSDFELVSVVISPKARKAMVQDPTGKGYFIQVGTRIGKNGGKVIRITEKEVVVQEPQQDFMGRKNARIIKLRPPV